MSFLNGTILRSGTPSSWARPGLILSLLVGLAGVCLPANAQVPANPDQNAALNAAAKMTEGQRTYFQKKGAFRATVSNIQQDFGITLPASFDFAVHTTTEAAYSYVIPAKSTQLVLGTLVANPTGCLLQCGDNSIEVKASVVNE